MAERIPDDGDLAVDELKRRARRRLVGAIVLALAAAVILPLLLEKEPKPLGDDVSVQIPPVDEGRFVNRLTGRQGDAKSAAKSDARPLPKIAPPKAEASPPSSTAPDGAAQPTPAAPPETTASPPAAPTNVPPPKKSVADAEKRVLAGAGKSGAAVKTELPPTAAAPSPPPASAAASPSPPPVSAALAPVAAPTTVAPAPAAPAPVAAAAATAAGEGFAVQIAAFTDDKGANALVGKLKKAGYASTYTEPVETSRGTLWRVRVGGFATRPDADTARAKLKTDGWNGIVVSAR